MSDAKPLLLLGLATALAPVHAQDESGPATNPDIPAALAPFEHVVGAWKGVGIPATNKLRGWPERHLWAWAFADGKPVALAVELQDSKILKAGRLSHDPAAGRYRQALRRSLCPISAQPQRIYAATDSRPRAAPIPTRNRPGERRPASAIGTSIAPYALGLCGRRPGSSLPLRRPGLVK